MLLKPPLRHFYPSLPPFLTPDALGQVLVDQQKKLLKILTDAGLANSKYQREKAAAAAVAAMATGTAAATAPANVSPSASAASSVGAAKSNQASKAPK